VEIEEYIAEATSGDYDHLLQTTMRWVDWPYLHVNPSLATHRSYP
jgi:hypothetical protein